MWKLELKEDFTKTISSLCGSTLHVVSISEMALRPMLAATMTSSCLRLFPAPTALPVARVMGLVHLTSSSGVAFVLGASSESKACKHKVDHY